MAKYNLKVDPQKSEITTLTPTSLDDIKTKKLGTYLSMDKEIYHRKALTLVAMNKLWILCHKNKISQNKKLRIFNAYILPILLYNCGTWSSWKTSEEKLDAFHRRLLRSVIGVFWPEKIPNEELYCKTSQIKLGSTIRNRRLTLLGYILRLSPDLPAQTLMEAYFQAPNKQPEAHQKLQSVRSTKWPQISQY